MKLWFFCFVAGRVWQEAKPQVKSEFRSIRPWGEIRVSWPGSRAAPLCPIWMVCPGLSQCLFKSVCIARSLVVYQLG